MIGNARNSVGNHGEAVAEPSASKASVAESTAAQSSPLIETPNGTFWVFGYGSLMWNPGFPYVEKRHAVLPGFHRRFCIRSTIYRGTPEQPGLVLGIDAGGECNGLVFRVAESSREAVVSYLYEREMRNHVYTPTLVFVLIEGERHEALTFVVKRDHCQFTCLPESETAEIIASCSGQNGSNFEYLENTVHALHSLGVPDPDLDVLHQRVRELRECS